MNRLAGYAFKLSLKLRHNPARLLFRDFFFRLTNPYDPAEWELVTRSWNGDVWDLGASVGKFTPILARANPNHRVFAFEPNLNSLYYLGYRTASFKNVIIVAAALTNDGEPIPASYDPDFMKKATGPRIVSFGLKEALTKFGKPAFIKMDIDCEEYTSFKKNPELLKDVHVLVEWHPTLVDAPIPPLNYWKVSQADVTHTYLQPF